MGKKRKTKEEKVILQLKRKIARQKAEIKSLKAKTEPRQESISKSKIRKKTKRKKRKKKDVSIFFYDSSLVKRDLFKSLILTLAVIGLEIVLYLRLR
jgi:hypothetical protein